MMDDDGEVSGMEEQEDPEDEPSVLEVSYCVMIRF